VKLLDSSVAIDYLRDHAPAVEIVEADQDWIGASEMTRFEILVGLKPDEEHAAETFFTVLGWVPISEPIARRAASLAREFRAAHSGIEDADYLIAATALELEADLVTTNIRHFPMLAGLEPAY
jgi:predicted nucleic acid-binding protein